MAGRIQLVVLDDDPTGIQTVHGCYVLTQWDEHTLREAFADSREFFYVLTNTRARTPPDARRTISAIVSGVLKVNEDFGYELVFMSRSDSTLRSHFPLEIDGIVETGERFGVQTPDAFFLVPGFFEGGRVTVGDVHYIVDGDRRIPTADTEFARDSVFGYGTSHLPSYIEEKTHGRIEADQVESISLEMLRAQPPRDLESLLNRVSDQRWVVVNCESYEDLNVLSSKLRKAIAKGKRFAFQCAASMVKSLSGIPDKPLLTDELRASEGPGVFVVGSYVRKTTAQLDRLLTARTVRGIEVDVQSFLDDPQSLRARILLEMRAALRDGISPVVYTSRRELRFATAQERLQVGQDLSLFLAGLVKDLDRPVSYVVAKGGITAHDVLAWGLEVTKARVMGQILPGVPVVRTPQDGRFGRIPCVIFPGNVGTEDSLLEVYNIFSSIGDTKLCPEPPIH